MHGNCMGLSIVVNSNLGHKLLHGQSGLEELKWSLTLVLVPPPPNKTILLYVELGYITYTAHESGIEVVFIPSKVGCIFVGLHKSIPLS